MTGGELGETTTPDGITLRWEARGDGPVVLLLHGFPETRASWRDMAERLAGAGFRAVAPDCRGVGASDAPEGISAYGAEKLAADVAALAVDVGDGQPVAVVGHDWGGLQAWWAAMLQPGAVARLVVANAAHPLAYATEPKRLSYRAITTVFEAPRVVDALSRATGFAASKRLLRREPVRPYPAALIAEYERAWRAPGATVAALNKYRAASRQRARVAEMVRPVACPVMTIWGDRDAYWGPEGATPPPDLAPAARVEHLPEATHWVVHDAAERVAALLIGFLRG